MDIKVNNKGNLEIDIKDLLSHLDDDEAQTLIEAMAWDSRMWKSIEEVVKNEHGAFSYNEELLKLRIAFLTEWDNDYDNPHRRVGDVVSALMTEINQQRESAREADRAYWEIYHKTSDYIRESGIQLKKYEHSPMRFFTEEGREIAEQYMPKYQSEDVE